MAGFVAFAIRNSRDTVLIAAAATKDEAMALEAQRILKLVAAREIDGLFALLTQTVDTFFDEKFPS